MYGCALTSLLQEGVKYLKRSAEQATAEFPHALHELALLHERGIDNVLFVDYEYAAELLAQAAELGYAPSAYRLGECYEYGKMGCPQDPALSIHYYVSRPLLYSFPLAHRALSRTSPRSRTIETPALRSRRGTWSDRQACCPSRTQKRTCGHSKRQRAAFQRPCMP